jgi:hypothetical protein
MNQVWVAIMGFRVPDLESVLAFKAFVFGLHTLIQSFLPSVVTLLRTTQ